MIDKHWARADLRDDVGANRPASSPPRPLAHVIATVSSPLLLWGFGGLCAHQNITPSNGVTSKVTVRWFDGSIGRRRPLPLDALRPKLTINRRMSASGG